MAPALLPRLSNNKGGKCAPAATAGAFLRTWQGPQGRLHRFTPAREQYSPPAEQEPISSIHGKYSQNPVSFAEWLSAAADRGGAPAQALLRCIRRERHCALHRGRAERFGRSLSRTYSRCKTAARAERELRLGRAARLHGRAERDGRAQTAARRDMQC